MKHAVLPPNLSLDVSVKLGYFFLYTSKKVKV